MITHNKIDCVVWNCVVVVGGNLCCLARVCTASVRYLFNLVGFTQSLVEAGVTTEELSHCNDSRQPKTASPRFLNQEWGATDFACCLQGGICRIRSSLVRQPLSINLSRTIGKKGGSVLRWSCYKYRHSSVSIPTFGCHKRGKTCLCSILWLLILRLQE